MPDFGKCKIKNLRQFSPQKNLFFFLFSLLTNFWIWSVIKQGKYWEFLQMIFLSLLLISAGSFKKKYWLILLLLALVFSQVFSLTTVFKFKEEEIYLINQRRSYFQNQSLGRVFENKISLAFFKYKKNFFQLLDINYYFFANHPRERVGIRETEKFSWLFLPIFLWGILFLAKKRNYFSIGYFSLLAVSISFFMEIDKLSFLVFPFFVFSIFHGLKDISEFKLHL